MSKVTPVTLRRLMGSIEALFSELTEEQADSLRMTVDSGLGVSSGIPGIEKELSENDLKSKVIIAESAARAMRIGVAYNGAVISMLRSGIELPKEDSERLTDTLEMLEDKLIEIGYKNISNMMLKLLDKAAEAVSLNPDNVNALEEMKKKAKALSEKIVAEQTRH